MAYEHEVVGWEDYDGGRHPGPPSDVTESWGMLVHAYDPATGASEHFWAFVPYTFDDWDQWEDYIDSMMDMYGLASE